MNTTTWTRAAIVRIVKTAAQAAIGSLTASAAFSEVDWGVVGGTTALAAILSGLTSLAGLPEAE